VLRLIPALSRVLPCGWGTLRALVAALLLLHAASELKLSRVTAALPLAIQSFASVEIAPTCCSVALLGWGQVVSGSMHQCKTGTPKRVSFQTLHIRACSKAHLHLQCSTATAHCCTTAAPRPAGLSHGWCCATLLKSCLLSKWRKSFTGSMPSTLKLSSGDSRQAF